MNIFQNKMTFPMAYTLARACYLFHTSVTESLSDYQAKNVLGTHIETLASEQGQEIYLPFIRVKTNADDMQEIQNINNVLGGNLHLDSFDYEKFGTGRIQVNQHGKLCMALFTGPNELYLTKPYNLWCLSFDGKIKSFRSKKSS